MKKPKPKLTLAKKARDDAAFICVVCQGALPFTAFEVVEGKKLDWCRDCAPVHAQDFGDDAKKREAAKASAWLDALREKTPCAYCGKVLHIHAWYKRDGLEVDFHSHIHIRGFELPLLKRIAAKTTALCVTCSELRHEHPRTLHAQLETTFFRLRQAALTKNEPLRKRLFAEYKTLQRKVDAADKAWLAKVEAAND
jgi:hypothetical protein